MRRSQQVSRYNGLRPNVAPELRDKYKDLIPTSIPVFPGGDWDKAVSDGWYRNVAPNVDRSK